MAPPAPRACCAAMERRLQRSTRSDGLPPRLLLLLLLGSHAVSGSAKCFCGSGSCAETRLGTVCGKTEQASDGAGLLPASMQVDAFYGVRYATIPLRFAPAEVANATYPLPYQATQPAPDCVGNGGVDKPYAGPTPKNHSHQGAIYSEDCLFVNIKRPTGAEAGDDLPVMVWIHGGGMMGGDDNMDFSRLAATQQIVLVNVNYRLGPLGFLSSEELEAENGGHGGTGGMNGQHDQITALKWVKANIRDYGGDPDAVTLFGQSAGGLSVCTVVASPLVKGLIKHAIIQSGSCTGAWGPGSREYGLAATRAMMEHLHVSTLAELRALPAGNLSWPASWPNTDAAEKWIPFKGYAGGPLAAGAEFPGYFVDGWVAPVHPSISYAKGEVNVEALMLGGTSSDGVESHSNGVCDTHPTDSAVNCSKHITTNRWEHTVNNSKWLGWDGYCVPMVADDYEEYMLKHWRPDVLHTLPKAVGAEVVEMYPVQSSDYNGSAPMAWTAADGDYNVVCPARAIARDVSSKSGKPVYLYYFSHGPAASLECERKGSVVIEGNCSGNVTHGWATHGADVGFLEGGSIYYTSNGTERGMTSAGFKDCNQTDEEVALSDRMQEYWATFAKTGQPAAVTSGGAHWPAFAKGEDGGAGIAMQLDIGELGGVREGLKAKQCEFWERIAALGPHSTGSRQVEE